MTLHDYLARQPKGRIIALALALVAAFGWLDYLTGPDYSLSILYLLPVFLAAWFGGLGAGVTVSVASAAAWFAAEALYAGRRPFPLEVLYWNDAVELVFFLVVTYILTSLKGSLDQEKVLARTDPLTAVANRRRFYELADAELYRSRRYGYPFSIAYIDIDNFKGVNDTLGHSEGDNLLRLVSETMQSNVRRSDAVARLGGDEFALLLPETGSEEALSVVHKIRSVLQELMQARRLPVTLSIGLVSYLRPPASVDDMIRMTDALMYAAKTCGKNRIRHEVVSRP